MDRSFNDPDVKRAFDRFHDEDDPPVRRSEFLALVRQMVVLTDEVDELKKKLGRRPVNQTAKAYELFAQGWTDKQVATELNVDIRNIAVYRGRYKKKSKE